MGLTEAREVGGATTTVSSGRPLRVWCLIRDQQAHVEPVRSHFGAAAEFVYDAEWNPDAMLRGRPDLILCVNDYPYEIARCIDAARERAIPSLVLQDGILEWRCQYENPLFGAGGGAAQHQPVLADRIACLGAQSARQIEAWGNSGKAVATGMPRLDYLIGRAEPALRRPGNRILVMTAKNPGFTPAQVEVTLRSLRDVKTRLEATPGVSVVWRTAGKITREIGVESQMRECASEELVDILARVDAVVTTPSTAMLEAMLLGRPVAALDYHNVPRFVATAWTIGAPDQVAPVLTEILNPPARKMAFQSDCLKDALACDGPAAPRVADLIAQMVGRRAGTSVIERPVRASAPLAALYPEEPIYQDHSVQSLQARLVRLQKENADLRREVERFTLGKGLHAFGRHFVQILRGGRS